MTPPGENKGAPEAPAMGSPEWVRQVVRVYLLADAGLVPAARLPEVVASAIEGGVTLVQLRMKGVTTLGYVALARTLDAVCRHAGVPFVVNDRVDVALASDADGVHVGHQGEEDMSPEDARRLVGPERIVGVSVGSAAEARRAVANGASYVSAGPMFATTTKANAGPAMGLPLLQEVRAAIEAPLVVIGGIGADSAASLYAAGADGLCIGSAILRATDPAAAARAFVEAAHATVSGRSVPR